MINCFHSKLFVSTIANLLQKYLWHVKQPYSETLLFPVRNVCSHLTFFPSSNGLIISAEIHKGWIDLKRGVMLFLPLFQSIKHDEEHKRPSVF